MLLRPHIRRTTSMTGITVDLPNIQDNPPEPCDHHHHRREEGSINDHNSNTCNSDNMSRNNGLHEYDQRFLDASMLSPRHLPTRRNSCDFLQTAHFLTTCGLCQRRLAPGKDIYMYRGDTAFCSLECREKQMKHDERKEKSSKQ